MAIKISNIKTEQTEEQYRVEWIKALSRRNKHLSATDWTQLPDVPLTPECKAVWTDWRSKMRNIKKLTHDTIESVDAAIDSLEASIPTNIYIDGY